MTFPISIFLQKRKPTLYRGKKHTKMIKICKVS